MIKPLRLVEALFFMDDDFPLPSVHGSWLVGTEADSPLPVWNLRYTESNSTTEWDA